jgi:hypothetical protein
MDWRTARLYAAAMSWPVILVSAWLGNHFGGAVGMFIGTFVGIAAYFLGIWRAMPKDDPPPAQGGKDDSKEGENRPVKRREDPPWDDDQDQVS